MHLIFCFVSMSDVPSPEVLHALLDPQLCSCKRLEPAFVHLDGGAPLPAAEQLEFMYKAAYREIENRQREKTKNDFLRPQSATIAAAALKAAQAQVAAAKPLQDDLERAAHGMLRPNLPRRILLPRRVPFAAAADCLCLQLLPKNRQMSIRR